MPSPRALWFSHLIAGRQWDVYLSDRATDPFIWDGQTPCDGICYFKFRAILVAADAPRDEWASTLLHELAHAASRRLHERTVRAIERKLAPALAPYWRPPRLPPEAEKLARRVRARQRRQAREDR